MSDDIDWKLEYVWKGDIATALCIIAGGWSTQEEHAVLLGAHKFIAKVRDDALRRAIPHCDKCGQKLP